MLMLVLSVALALVSDAGNDVSFVVCVGVGICLCVVGGGVDVYVVVGGVARVDIGVGVCRDVHGNFHCDV